MTATTTIPRAEAFESLDDDDAPLTCDIATETTFADESPRLDDLDVFDAATAAVQDTLDRLTTEETRRGDA